MKYKYVVFSDGENNAIALETMQDVRKNQFLGNSETVCYQRADAEAKARLDFVMKNFISRFGEYKFFSQKKSMPHKPKNACDWQEIVSHVYTFKDHTVLLKKGVIFKPKGEETKTEVWVDGRYDGFVQVYRTIGEFAP